MTVNELGISKLKELKDCYDIIMNSDDPKEITKAIEKADSLNGEVRYLQVAPWFPETFKSLFPISYPELDNMINNMHTVMVVGLENIVKACFKYRAFVRYGDKPVLASDGNQYKNYMELREHFIDEVESKNYDEAYSLFCDLSNIYKTDPCFLVSEYSDTAFMSKYIEKLEMADMDKIVFFEHGIAILEKYYSIADRFAPTRSYIINKYIEFAKAHDDWAKVVRICDTAIKYNLEPRTGCSFEPTREKAMKKLYENYTNLK